MELWATENNMPDAGFFTQLGLVAIINFLDTELCESFRVEMESAVDFPATVRAGREDVVDETVRRVSKVKVSPESKLLLDARLREVQPEMERHFGVTLRGFEKPQFLVYREGCFYTPHQDSTDDDEAEDYFKQRKVSVVIFLNDESDTAQRDSYGGGRLTFYGLLKDPLWEKCGLPLIGEAGLLIAFLSDVTHEVKPVIHGTRYSIVTWFF
ncbi:MAG: 2OG-Fe(II) oxygenase [Blastocatellia bacterium]